MSSITDPYDGLDLGADSFKSETPGEQIEIEVKEIRPIETKDGKPGALVVGVDDHGVTREWVAWNRIAKAELRRERPMPGERLRIEYLGRDPHATTAALAARLWRLSKPTGGDGGGAAAASPGGGQQDGIPFLPSIDGTL